MKHLGFLICILMPLALEAQDIAGTYHMEIKSTNGFLSRTLTLKADSTFIFHAYEKHERRIPNELNLYGKGIWTLDKKVIYFTSEILNDSYTLSFNNSKARFNTKSPRDQSNRDIKTSIRIYETEVSIAKGLKLIKE